MSQPSKIENFNFIAQTLADYLATLPVSSRQVMTPVLQQALAAIKPEEKPLEAEVK